MNKTINKTKSYIPALVLTTFFLLLLNWWDISEIQRRLIELAVLVLISMHLLEIVSGARKRPIIVFRLRE